MSFESRPPSARRFLSEDAPPATFAQVLETAPHGFFGRKGGVSRGIYASLNAGPGSRDAPEAVSENRRRIAAGFGLAPGKLIGVHQVHSAKALRADAPWEGPRPEGDALATATPGLALSILTADCAPVLLADVEAGVIGAAHAGWKGALGGVLHAAVRLMQSLGAEPSRIAAAIGPCIHQANYEVGPEFRERFMAADKAHAQFFVAAEGDRLRFDLPGFCASRLSALGVADVEISSHCTYADEVALFSHRRSVHRGEGDYGRNCAVIMLP